MAWGDSVSDVSDASEAVDVVNYVLENSGEKITFISLGSLGTARLCAEKCPGFRTRVSRILWSNSPDDRTHSFNFNLDRISASRVLSGNTPVCLISGGSLDHYDTALIDAIGELNTLCAVKVKSSLQTSENPYARAFFDESTAVFLHYPSLFHADTAGTLIQYKLRPSGAGNDIHSAISLILSGETVIQNQVLNRFPLDTSCYFADVQHGMQETLSRFGREEWIAGVMANEMHRHLGVYAVIGVKMGIRAKEYFGAGIDEMSIISYAGSTPPFSCMNDGLQVSTGATLGHGLIKITSDSPILPQADFIYMNRRIRLTLKPEVRSKVDSEIRELSRIYGLDSNIYWELVRKAAIMYWNTLDRQDIFTVQVL
jgi:pyrimidine-specific ribonucleoside hydrolase